VGFRDAPGLGLSARLTVELFLDDLVAQLDALIADIDSWPGDELSRRTST
jgi:hypothetical protein